MLDIKIRPRAQTDIENTYLYIQSVQGLPQAASDFADAVYTAIERLAEFPDMGARFVHEALEQEYRRVLSGNYWIYYSHDGSTVTVWRIFHTRQDTDDFNSTILKG